MAALQGRQQKVEWISARQLEVGDRIVNVGNVEAISAPVGVFIDVTVTASTWDPVTGKVAWRLVLERLHNADDVAVQRG